MLAQVAFVVRTVQTRSGKVGLAATPALGAFGSLAFFLGHLIRLAFGLGLLFFFCTDLAALFLNPLSHLSHYIFLDKPVPAVSATHFFWKLGRPVLVVPRKTGVVGDFCPTLDTTGCTLPHVGNGWCLFFCCRRRCHTIFVTAVIAVIEVVGDVGFAGVIDGGITAKAGLLKLLFDIHILGHKARRRTGARAFLFPFKIDFAFAFAFAREGSHGSFCEGFTPVTIDKCFVSISCAP